MDPKGIKYQAPPPYPDPDNLGYEPLAQPPPPIYVVAPMIFGSYSQQCFCPNCRNSVYTNVVPKSGMGTWLAAGGICITGLWCGCQLIPFCVESCKDKEHYCPNCNAFLGVRKLI